MQKKFENNIFFFHIVKTNTKKERLENPKKEKLFLLIPENIGERKLSIRKTIKYQLDIEFQTYQFFLIDCQSYTFLFINIIISEIFI